MRGSDAVTGAMFSYVDIEARVPAKHPIRVIRRIVNEVLAGLDADFAAVYAAIGRPSIAPERLLRASLLQAFFTVRSERLLMERLDYDLMFRWFVGLGIDDPVWDHSTFSKNRDRLLQADIARKFLRSILEHKEVAPLLSDEHFTVDGTLVTAWASLKSFVPKDAAAKVEPPPPDNDSAGKPPESEAKPEDEAAGQPQKQEPAAQLTSAEPSKPESATPMQIAAETGKRSRNEEVDFHGQKRCNDTHVSTTDPQARLFRKGPGKEARLSYMGHAMTENRHGLWSRPASRKPPAPPSARRPRP
jgi:transposase